MIYKSSLSKKTKLKNFSSLKFLIVHLKIFKDFLKIFEPELAADVNDDQNFKFIK